MIEEYEDDADFAWRNGEYDNEVDEYGKPWFVASKAMFLNSQ